MAGEVLVYSLSSTELQALLEGMEVGIAGSAAEGAALPSVFVVVAGDDGTDTHPLQLDALGSLKSVLQAGEAHVGEIGTGDDLLEVTLTLDTSAYADGDVLADTQEIANAMRAAGQPVILQSLVVLDNSDQAQALDILILRSNTSIGTENAAFSPSDAVAAEILAVVEIATGDYYDMTNNQLVRKNGSDTGMGMVLEATSGTSLFIASVSRGTGTYAADGIVVKLGFLRS